MAERVLDALSGPIRLEGQRSSIVSTASIGIVTSDYGYGRAEDVLRDADTAMYEAKLQGRGRAVWFDGSMRDRVQRKLAMESDLRKALDQGELFLEYQPILSLESGAVESVEALCRWQHPQAGRVSPGEFIPVAEDCGLILAIGEWVLKEACRQLAQWRRDAKAAAGPAELEGPAGLAAKVPPSISVNLSRAQLAMPDLAARVGAIIAEAGLDPACVHLEITENAVMRDQDAAIRTLKQLKELGVKLDLDDFGTGYSSLASLHLFPIDVLKIDRSFVANLARGRDFAALVHAVTDLARNLGIAVIAEGIETLEQLHMLQAMGCSFGQGYLFSRPLAAAAVPEVMGDAAEMLRRADSASMRAA